MVFIVDWDIPEKRRRMFYYYLNKIKASREISGSMSSMSVMMTEDEGLAREVYELALKYGRTSLYEGRLLASNNHAAPGPGADSAS